MKQIKKIIPLAILAGICISIGCVVNLRVGGVAGAVLFAFGLTTVVYYGLKLYTGTAGFIRMKGDWTMLCLVLLGNIIGWVRCCRCFWVYQCSFSVASHTLSLMRSIFLSHHRNRYYS